LDTRRALGRYRDFTREIGFSRKSASPDFGNEDKSWHKSQRSGKPQPVFAIRFEVIQRCGHPVG